jgi:hypothetical protein
MLATIALAIVAQTAPAATASPPKEIIEVHSRALCTTMEQRVRPALVGLMQNDTLIDSSERALSTVGADKIKGGSTSHGEPSVGFVVSGLLHNIRTVDEILDAPAHFPLSPATNDERTADDVKAQLLTILSRQKMVLNAISGTFATAQLGDMRSEFPLSNPIVGPSTSTSIPGVDSSASLFGAAGINDPHVINMAALLDSDLLGMTIYDHLSRLIAEHQAVSRVIEAHAADTIVHAFAGCSPSSPQSAP